MGLEVCIKLIKEYTRAEISIPDGSGICQWKQGNYVGKIYQKSHKIYWECFFGDPLRDNLEYREILSQILQFNLKRMRFLDINLLFEQKMQQLYLQKVLKKNELNEKNTGELFDDFITDVEVIQERFFHKKLS